MEHSMNRPDTPHLRLVPDAVPPSTWRPLGALVGALALRAATSREGDAMDLLDAGPAVAWAAE